MGTSEIFEFDSSLRPDPVGSRFFTFIGGATGPWQVTRIDTVAGPGVAAVERIDISNRYLSSFPQNAEWLMRGATSNERYVTRAERALLGVVQPPLGRAEASCAALIPLTKSAQWWQLAQDERRDILATRSAHISEGLKHLPAVARRLHHSRDLGEAFDFLTWFEFAPSYAAQFDEFVAALRRSEEWRYVEREIDIRLTRIAPAGKA